VLAMQAKRLDGPEKVWRQAHQKRVREGACNRDMRGLKPLWAVILLLGGCGTTPYIAARHIDATPINGGSDGWDVACGGWKKRGQLQLKAGYCLNVRGGDMFEASIEYELFGREE